MSRAVDRYVVEEGPLVGFGRKKKRLSGGQTIHTLRSAVDRYLSAGDVLRRLRCCKHWLQNPSPTAAAVLHAGAQLWRPGDPRADDQLDAKSHRRVLRDVLDKAWPLTVARAEEALRVVHGLVKPWCGNVPFYLWDRHVRLKLEAWLLAKQDRCTVDDMQAHLHALMAGAEKYYREPNSAWGRAYVDGGH